MNLSLNSLLTQLEKHQIQTFSDTTDEHGWRTIVVGCAAPQIPFGLGRILYYTLVLTPGQTEVALEEREAMRRRLWHATTDLFGDDASGLTGLDQIDISDLLENIPERFRDLADDDPKE